MTGDARRQDAGLQRAVLEALWADPSLDVSRLGVTVMHRVLKLGGLVGDLAERLAAERILHALPGVTMVLNDLALDPQVRPADGTESAR